MIWLFLAVTYQTKYVTAPPFWGHAGLSLFCIIVNSVRQLSAINQDMKSGTKEQLKLFWRIVVVQHRIKTFMLKSNFSFDPSIFNKILTMIFINNADNIK